MQALFFGFLAPSMNPKIRPRPSCCASLCRAAICGIACLADRRGFSVAFPLPPSRNPRRNGPSSGCRLISDTPGPAGAAPSPSLLCSGFSGPFGFAPHRAAGYEGRPAPGRGEEPARPRGPRARRLAPSSRLRNALRRASGAPESLDGPAPSALPQCEARQSFAS
jgi:hypothetical protein